MPLSAELEKVVNLIQDPAQREATRKRMQELEEGGLRQSDYSKKMNELETREKDRAAQHAANLKWHQDNQTYYKQSLAERDSAKKEAEAAAARLKQLEAANTAGQQSGDFDPADSDAMAKALREARAEAVTAKQAASQLETEVKRIAAALDSGDLMTREKFNEEANRRLNAYGTAMFAVDDYLRKAETEFGKPVDRATLRNQLLEASNRFNGDLEASYKSVTEDMRIEKMRADMRAEIEKEYTEKRKADGLPISTGEAPIVGPLQQRVFQNKPQGESSIDPNIKVGTGALAHAIAADMRARGES
jgi:hypothetical protein